MRNKVGLAIEVRLTTETKNEKPRRLGRGLGEEDENNAHSADSHD